MRAILIFTILVVLGVDGYFGYRWYLKREAKKRAAAEASLAPRAVEREPVAEPTAVPAMQPAADPKLKSFHVSCASDGCKLNVEIRIDGVCHLGDFNFISIDLHQASDKPVLRFSIEPLSKTGVHFPPLGREITLDELSHGIKISYRLPPFEKPVQLGVFLCKDAKHEKACSGKEFMDLDAGLSKFFSERAKDAKYRSPDHLYFFQYLLWEAADRMTVFDDTSPMDMTPDRYLARLNHVASLNPGAASEYKEAMSHVEKMSQALKSMNLETSDSKIVLVVPKNAGCRK